MYKYLLIVCIFIFALPAFSANRYVRAAGGNSSAAATWASTSGGTDSVAVPTSSDDVFLDAASGQLTIDATFSCKNFDCTGYTNTLTVNGGTLQLNVNGNFKLVPAMTFTVANSFILATVNTACLLTSAGKAMSNININGTGTLTLGDNLTFVADKNPFISLANTGALNLGGFTVSGNSITNRLIIRSSTGAIGTTRSVVVNGGTFANCDFRDIQFSLASDLDLSAITGGSGDCGGNSITGGGTVLTFTTAVDQHWTSGVTGNWSNVARWTSRVPLPQDNVFFDVAFSASQTVTSDMPRLGKTIDWTGATGTPTFAMTSVANTIYGGLTLISGMTLTANQNLVFEGRGAFNFDIQNKIFASSGTSAFTISMVGGTFNLLSAIGGIGGTLILGNGTLIDNGYTINAFNFNSNNSNLRTITKSGNWISTRNTAGNAFDFITKTNLTFTDTGTNTISDNGTAAKTFIGNGLTFNDLSITGGGTGAIIITGSNTFNNITVNAPKTLNLTAGTTQTVSSFTAVGTAVNGITIQSTTAGTPATLSDASGSNILKYCSIKDITATGGAKWVSPLALGNTNVSGNTGWTWYLALGLFWIND